MEYYCENYDSLTTEMRGDSRKLNGGEWQLNQYLQSPCFQSKNLCFRPVKNGWFRPRKKVLSLKVFDWTLCWSLLKCLNFHSEAPEVEFSRHYVFFSIIKTCRFWKTPRFSILRISALNAYRIVWQLWRWMSWRCKVCID